MPEPCECPPRKALAETLCWSCGIRFSIAQANGCVKCQTQRAALSAPCPREELRADLAEALDALRGIAYEADRKSGHDYLVGGHRFERAAAVLAKHPEVKA